MPARAPCTHTMHPPATSSISRRYFSPMYPNGFSMNRRKQKILDTGGRVARFEKRYGKKSK